MIMSDEVHATGASRVDPGSIGRFLSAGVTAPGGSGASDGARAADLCRGHRHMWTEKMQARFNFVLFTFH